jgi:endoglucanase
MRGFILFFLVVTSFLIHAQIPFQKGVNLTQWFQAPSAGQIQFTRFTKKDFENIKSLGCDVIRLPVNLHAMTSGAPDYALDPLLFKFLDQAVAWSEELNIYLILDNHSFDPLVDTQPEVEDILVKVWTQLAIHYKDSGPYLLYEVLNEPHGISDVVWGSIQQSVIDAIRIHDQDHYIVVGGTNYNSYTTLHDIPVYDDEKLIYTFHFYDPFLFTHQGASWVSPSLVPLANIPFPYKASSMPPLPLGFQGTWIQSAYNNYVNDGTLARVKQLLDVAIDFRSARNVPVFCGEFGVYIPNSKPAERVAWYKEIRAYLDEHSIPWTAWDYTGGFGVFEPNSNELFEYDLNVPLLEALQFNVVPQKTFSMKPKTSGLTIYDDYAGEGIQTSTYGGSSFIDFYNGVNPYRGDHSIRWKDGEQYETITFDFHPDANLSLLPDHGYELSFWVRCNSSEASFDIRFVDTKTGESDRPWRMGITVDQALVNWNGEWQRVVVPLADMEEKGSWDDGWYEPDGKFQWPAIDRLEIVAEQSTLVGVELFFDDIQLMGEEITVVLDVEENSANRFLNVYPNPLRSQAIIEFSTSVSESAAICIYNQKGQLVRRLPELYAKPGINRVVWSGDDDSGERVSSGLYLVRVMSNDSFHSERVVVLD